MQHAIHATQSFLLGNHSADINRFALLTIVDEQLSKIY